MFKLLLIAVVATIAVGLPHRRLVKKMDDQPLPAVRIVGGNDANIKVYPYQLVLEWYGYFLCGAVLISDKYALTTASCVSYRDEADEFSVRAGSSAVTGGKRVYVTKIYDSPDFNQTTLDYDLAILELEETISGVDAKRIQLVDAGYVAPDGFSATVTGWGHINEDGYRPSVLQAVTTNIVGNSKCSQAYGDQLTDRMLCAGDFQNGGKDICAYDEGGPLTVNNKLVGLASWGEGCGRAGYPGVYTAIGNVDLRLFILKTVGI